MTENEIPRFLPGDFSIPPAGEGGFYCRESQKISGSLPQSPLHDRIGWNAERNETHGNEINRAKAAALAAAG